MLTIIVLYYQNLNVYSEKVGQQPKVGIAPEVSLLNHFFHFFTEVMHQNKTLPPSDIEMRPSFEPKDISFFQISIMIRSNSYVFRSE